MTLSRTQVTTLLVVTALAAGCGSPGTSQNAGSPSEILVGHYASMTGSEATFGQSTDNGIRLAIDEINAAGGVNGKQIKLITYDDKGDTKETGAAVTRLVTKDQVTAVIGEVASTRSLAGAPVCQQYGVPMISPSSTNPRVTEVGDMIFRICFIDPFQGYVCAKFAREHESLKADKVAILYDQSGAYSKGLAEEFQKAFTALGGTISENQAYNNGDQDFTAQLTAIRSSDPDMIFVPGYYTDVGNIALQARQLGITVPLFGGDGWDSSQLAVIGGDAVNGCFYANHYSHEDPSPRVQDFIAKYKARFGTVPDGLAALGYDAAMLLFDAMKRSPSLNGDDLAKAIAQTKDFDGVTGKISIDEQRNAVKPAVILEMKNGTPTYLTTIAP